MSGYRRMAELADRVVRQAVPPVAGMVICVVLCVLAGGCAGDQVTRLRDAAEFEQVALRGDKPVLVDFYKGGCPTCIPVDGMMDKLAEEYKGRAVITKFLLVQPYFAVTSPELKEKYAIDYFPTVILFVHGRETWRFMRRYDLDEYRKAMNEALAVPTTQRTVNSSTAASPRASSRDHVTQQR
jgi:thioredoxin 1